MKTHVLRLKPGQDLYDELKNFVDSNSIKAAAVLTCVGSLNQVHIRLASARNSEIMQGPFEIVSLVGTLSPSGNHLHIGVSDSNGRTLGGHLRTGSTILTTAELVIGELKDFEFSREQDCQTGYLELIIKTL